MKGILKISLTVLAFAILTILFTSNLFADTYKIDPTHSTFGFAVKHIEVGITRGQFTDYSGEVKFDSENLKEFHAWAIIKAKSISTRLEARDNHLRGEHFFYTEKYPTIIFSSRKIVKKDGKYEIIGSLTMRGVTKQISIPVTISGPIRSPFGSKVIGISGETVINRQDYGISWNDVMPDGGFVVGNNVMLTIDLEADRK